MRHTLIRRLGLGAAALAGAGVLAASQVAAQIPEPPSTVFGSVTDEAGPVDENLPVEAYINDQLCGEGLTGFTGDGDAQVTVYFAEVVSDQQEAGCGVSGAEVRLKIGDRFADETFAWERGPVRLDVTFGEATPAAIPTFTPTPTRTATPEPEGTTPPTEEEGTPGAEETIPPGSPGAGSPVPGGGVTSSSDPQAAGDGDGDGGGFPIWAVAVLLLGGIAVVGGGVGFAMSRNHEGEDDDFYPPSDDDFYPSNDDEDLYPRAPVE